MGKRHTGRRLVMQALYEAELSATDPKPIIQRMAAENQIEKGTSDFAESLINVIISHQEEIDIEIRKYLRDWEYERIAQVDKSILRLAMGELLFVPDVAGPVVLDEAVTLAQEYGGEESPNFVNGLLGAAFRDRYNPGKVS